MIEYQGIQISDIFQKKSFISIPLRETLPEVQQTQAINSVAQVIFQLHFQF